MVTKLEDEVALTDLPPQEGWSENYCFDGFDSMRNIGFWLHLGRWSQNPKLWREQLLIYMPDGTFLLRRSVGYRDAPRGAAGAALELRCDEPGEVWHLIYDGPARAATTAELADAPLREGPMRRLEFDLEFRATGELWDFFGDKAHEGVAFAQHIEQPGTVKGRFAYKGETFEIDALGYRDHSRGVRDLTDMYDHSWIHGHFAGEASFACFGLRKRKDGVIAPEFEMAVVWQKGKLFKAQVERIPYMTAPVQPGDYQLKLSGDFGEMLLDARIQRTLPVTLDTRFEFMDGTIRNWGAMLAFEQPTSVWWEGRQGTAHTERSTVK